MVQCWMLFLSSVQVLSAASLVEGFHVQVRDESQEEGDGGNSFDAVTLSGGGTRSHTLSDLRPHTK